MLPRSPFLLMAFLSLLFTHKISCSFIISNNCPFTIWPGILASAGNPALSTTGFELESGMSVKIFSTPGWSGRMWARTGCKFDKTGLGTCLTGDCGGRLECKGNGATPPASLFEITLAKGTTDKDFYDVSLVDGYNLPIIAWPLGVYGSECNATGCISDINLGCPKELQVMGKNENDGGSGNGVVACMSACEAFGSDQYCCSGEYANPNTCKPSSFSIVFKKACPSAYSYAFDDKTSTFTCKANDYAILFCPTANRAKKPAGQHLSPPPPATTTNIYPPPPPEAGYTYASQPPPHMHSNSASMEEITSSCVLRLISLLLIWLGFFNLLG